MFISSLTLRNILSFRDPSPLELRPLSILIGANASGKSNLIACIRLLQSLPNSLNRFINQRGGTEAWIWRGPKRTDDVAKVACQFESEQEKLDDEITFRAVEHELVIQSEALGRGENPRALYADLSRWVDDLKIVGQPTPEPGTPGIARNESALAAYRNPHDPTPITRSARAFNDIRIYRDFYTGERDDARLGVSSSGPKHPIE